MLRAFLSGLSLIHRAQDFVQNNEQLLSKWTETKELNRQPIAVCSDNCN